MALSSEKKRYVPPVDIVCPTCHRRNEARIMWTMGNVLRVLAAVPQWILFTVSLTGENLRRRCTRCGAKFMPREVAADSDRTCWNCGYSLWGLPEPRCPECGTEFPAWVLEEMRQAE